jgi:exonuclease III
MMDLLIHVKHYCFSSSFQLIYLVRYLYPDKRDAYTYWAYFRNARQRNIGWRLDYFILSSNLQESICDVILQNGVYGSDHCPIVLLLSL